MSKEFFQICYTRVDGVAQGSGGQTVGADPGIPFSRRSFYEASEAMNEPAPASAAAL